MPPEAVSSERDTKSENMDHYLKETAMLDYTATNIQHLIRQRRWRALNDDERVLEIYNYVRDEILFGYNKDDALPASQILREGYGQCNTKSTLFMALLRTCGIKCRLHGYMIDKRLQKGAMTGIVYKSAPARILHSDVEVLLEGKWYELEGFILDQAYLKKLQTLFKDHEGTFCGYGVAVKDLQHPPIDFQRNDTFIQSEGITADLGLYDSPDDFLRVHRQNMSPMKKLAYQHLGRRLMNRNIRKIRTHS